MAVDYDNDLPPIELDIDIDNRSGFPVAKIQQYDDNAQWIIITLWNNGSLFTIPDGTVAQFACTKPSGLGILHPCVIENNKIYYQITLQTSVEYGNFEAEIRLGRSATSTVAYSSPKFKLNVNKSALQNNTIMSMSEVNVLTQLIVDANDSISDANTATQNANTATSNANTATTNANTATSAANTAATNASNAAILANTKAGLADISTTNANTATINANNAATSATNAASTANTAATNANTTNTNVQNAETTRQNYYNAYKVCVAYNGSTAYVIGNKVIYQGSTYQCILNSTGNLPTNTTYWILIAQKGSDGVGGDMFKSTYDPNNKNTDSFNSSNIVYDHTVSGLTATNVKTAIDELSASQDALEKIVTISISQPTDQPINSYWFVETIR